MGIRERLESIRTQNESSRDTASDDLARGAEWNDRPALNPWLTIWMWPSETIRAIVDTNPGHHVVTIAAVVGFARALTRAETRGLGDHLPLLGVVGVCALLGPLLSLISLYVGGEVLRVIGGWLGGRARAVEVRAALAWASVPHVIVGLLWLSALLVFGDELFTKAKPRIMGDPASRYVLSAILIVDLILLVWSIILSLVCLAEVLRISAWRILATITLTAAAVFGIMFVSLLPFLSEATLALPGRRAPPVKVVAPVTRPASVPPSPPVERRSKRPSAEYGPVVAAIWEEGVRVDAEVDRDHPDRPIVKLHIDRDLNAVTDDVLRRLQTLPDLRSLEIGYGKGVSDAGMRHLRGLHHLERLSIAWPSITDAGMRHLRGLHHLEELSFAWANITDAGLENLSELSALRTLNLMACERINGPGLTYLEGATELRTLSLFGCGINAEGLASVQQLTLLKELNIGGMRLDDACLAHLEGLVHLEKLDLGGMNPIHGPGLIHLEGLPDLRELDLVNDPVTDEAIDHLIELKGLNTLNLNGTQITPAGLDRLRAALPGTKIYPVRLPERTRPSRPVRRRRTPPKPSPSGVEVRHD